MELADLRLDEAALLLEYGRPSGAFYLAGYAVECALKAIIASRYRGGAWAAEGTPEGGYHHDLRGLLVQAGLHAAMRKAQRVNKPLAENWYVAVEWKTTSRYQQFRRRRAEALVKAIRDEKAKVLPWLKQRV